MPTRDNSTNGAFRKIKNLGRIPSDWDVVQLGSLTSVVTSGSRGWSKYVTGDGAIFVRSQNIGQGNLRWDDVAYVRPPIDQEAERARIKFNDLLISVTGEPGNVALATESVVDGFVSQHVALVRLNDEALAPWAAVALSSAVGQSQFQSKMYGQTRPGLNLDNIGELLIPMPPETERRLIRQTLNAVDDVIVRTRSVIDQTLSLRTAVLHALLTNGFPERHARFVKHHRLGRRPESWNLLTLRQVCTRITDGVHQSVPTANSGIPFLYVSSVRNGEINWTEAASISEAVYREISRGREPEAGAVLYTVVGSYGHAALVTDNRPFSFQRHVSLLKADSTKLMPEFLALWLNSEIAKSEADRVALGNAQKTITLGELSELLLPVPPLDEQRALVTAVTSIECRRKAESAYLSRLEQSRAALSQSLLTGRVRMHERGK